MPQMSKTDKLRVKDFRKRLDLTGGLNNLRKAERELKRIMTATEETSIVDEKGRTVLMPAKVPASRVAAAKALIDSSWKRINKFIPDARQEHDVTSGGQPIGGEREMTSLEVVNRLAWLRRKAYEEAEAAEAEEQAASIASPTFWD